MVRQVSRLSTAQVALLLLVVFMAHPLDWPSGGAGVMAWSTIIRSPLCMAVSSKPPQRRNGSRRVEALSSGARNRKPTSTFQHVQQQRQPVQKSKTSRPMEEEHQRKSLPTTTTTSSINDNTHPPPANTIGQAVQFAQTVSELLNVAADIWLPTDPELPSHLRTQAVHHEKRQRWSAQLLTKLGDSLLQQPPFLDTTSAQEIDADDIWHDERLARAVLGAAYPFGLLQNNHEQSGAGHCLPAPTENERRSVVEALVGLHAIMGKQPPATIANHDKRVHADVTKGIQLLLERAEAMANGIPMYEAAQVRWAARGILARLGPDPFASNASKNEFLAAALPNLERRVAGLPFDILPLGVDVDQVIRAEGGNQNHDSFAALHACIPFNFDTITTRTGVQVTERRGTAWVAEEGIGAMAYSGKLMPPAPLPDLVRKIMQRVEHAMDLCPQNGDDVTSEQPDQSERAATFFDCALCNWYPHEEASCRFHTDPEHGISWERLNCVVSVGEARRFAFRPIPGISTWNNWDTVAPLVHNEDNANTPAVIHFFANDVVSMWGTCNDDFHHAVYSGRPVAGRGPANRGRISLVLKRAMVHGKNRRGHGLAGEGRRSRRQR